MSKTCGFGSSRKASLFDMRRPHVNRKAYKLFFPASSMDNLTKPASGESKAASDSPAEGKAYSFFKYDGEQQDIEAQLPWIRESLNTPSQLELSLTENTANFHGDAKLLALALESKKCGHNYALRAVYPGETNETTADELAAILYQAYQSPLYMVEEGAPFEGNIFYKDEATDEYIARD